MYIYYCPYCNGLNSFEDQTGDHICSCGGKYIPMLTSVEEWNKLSNDAMLALIKRATDSAEDKPIIKVPDFNAGITANTTTKTITEQDFVQKYPCPNCGSIGEWEVTSWPDDPLYQMYSYCKHCYTTFNVVVKDLALSPSSDKVSGISIVQNTAAKLESRDAQLHKCLTEKEFHTKFPCPFCSNTGMWAEFEWVNDPSYHISTKCMYCNALFDADIKDLVITKTPKSLSKPRIQDTSVQQGASLQNCISEKDFSTQFPCPNCGSVGTWNYNPSLWPTDPDEKVSAECKVCKTYFSEHYKDINLTEALRTRRRPGITEKEFKTQFPCPRCRNKGIWELTPPEWPTDPSDGLTAFCKKCGFLFNAEDLYDVSLSKVKDEIREYEESVRSIKAPWDTTYYSSPCPFCGEYKVRANKWDDMKNSVAFWGFFSSKLHDRYKCDACGTSWR